MSQAAAPWECTGGASHILSPVENLADERVVVECIACDREFVQELDGALTPLVQQHGARGVIDRAHRLFDQFTGGLITPDDLVRGLDLVIASAWDVLRAHYTAEASTR